MNLISLNVSIAGFIAVIALPRFTSVLPILRTVCSKVCTLDLSSSNSSCVTFTTMLFDRFAHRLLSKLIGFPVQHCACTIIMCTIKNGVSHSIHIHGKSWKLKPVVNHRNSAHTLKWVHTFMVDYGNQKTTSVNVCAVTLSVRRSSVSRTFSSNVNNSNAVNISFFQPPALGGLSSCKSTKKDPYSSKKMNPFVKLYA